MAKAGDELINRLTGLRTIFRKTAQETNGELLQVDWIGDPGWIAGEKHVHPHQEERFTVLAGRLGAHVNGVEHVYEAGEVVVAPAGSVHTVWNAGDEHVHALVEFRPALRSETVLELLAALANQGKANAKGGPSNPFELAMLLREYEPELYVAVPPLVVQRVLFGILAPIGRWLGYRIGAVAPDSRTAAGSPARRSVRSMQEEKP